LFTAAGLHRHLGLPTTLPGMRHVWNQYVVRVPDGLRTPLREALAEAKIGTEIYYPLGLHQQECFRYLGYKPEDLPETARAAEEVLALPIFPELRGEEQRHVVQRIAAFYAARQGGHAIQPPKFLTRRAGAAATKA
jgi:dTDP-4-amino-4,6-dideoxygalactose transaminase